MRQERRRRCPPVRRRGDASGRAGGAHRAGRGLAARRVAGTSADTARLLGHLYDAVDCEALPAGFAARLQSLLEVPVYDSLAREDHPIFDLLSALVPAGRTPTAADRCTLVQAALVSTLL
jgi:hypothetical protein